MRAGVAPATDQNAEGRWSGEWRGDEQRRWLRFWEGNATIHSDTRLVGSGSARISHLAFGSDAGTMEREPEHKNKAGQAGGKRREVVRGGFC